MEMIGGMGVEGFVFFWLFWVYWVLATFFMKKEKARTLISLWLLVVICLSIYSISLFNIEVSLASFFILGSTYFCLGNQKYSRLLYGIISSFIIMLAFTVFQLYELYDPVWVMFDRTLLLASLVAYLTILLHTGLYERVLTVLTGVIHGDILYRLILNKILSSHYTGIFASFDVLAISMTILLVIGGLKKVSMLFEGSFKQQEKEKQKLS